jgi:uncharacterized protein
MKKILVAIITFYQRILSPIMKQLLGVSAMCRYSPSCSEYARMAIIQHGVFQGSLLGIKRLATCHPWYNPKTAKSKK